MSEKPVYAPLPVRALGDARLSGAHLRVLAATSAHDRFAKNGTGCFASYRRLASMTGLSIDAVKHAISDLAEWGYLRIEANPIDARRRVLFVEYTTEDSEAMRGDGRSFTKHARPRLARIGAETNTDSATAPQRRRAASAAKVGAETNTEKAEIGVQEKIQAFEIVDVPERNIFPERDNRFREARLGGEKVAARGEAEAEIERAEAVAKQVRSREMEPEDGLDALRRILARLKARRSGDAADRVEAIARAVDVDGAGGAPPVDLQSARASPGLLASRASMLARGAS
jgi:DNA-binding MarR family transcriptional regulator